MIRKATATATKTQMPKIATDMCEKKSFYERCIRPFFFSSRSEYLKAPYFWASVMLLLTVGTIVQIMAGRSDLIPLAGIEAGLILGLIAVYNQGNKNANNLPK